MLNMIVNYEATYTAVTGCILPVCHVILSMFILAILAVLDLLQVGIGKNLSTAGSFGQEKTTV